MACRVLLLFLSACLVFLLVQAEQEKALSAPGPYEKLGRHLGDVTALSRRYWRLLACQVWQRDCEEEQEGEDEQEEKEALAEREQQEEEEKEVILEQQGWNWPMVTEMVSSWYCRFGKCCATGDCRVTNNITGLELDLSRRLHGQHLVKHVVLKAVQGFLETPNPEKALTLSFHGWSGTGKNFVARMMAEHLYRDGLKSNCVRVFISLFHFPHSKYVDIYKVQLAREISETVQGCEQSLFIFDEAEKLHAGLLDVLKPYVDHHDSIDMVNYRRSIFLFLSNTGGNIINEVALDFWRAGRAREEITLEFLEPYLRTELMGATDEGYTQNSLLEENLIDFLVPFLPLEYRHVRLCARDAFLTRGLPFTEEALDEVARMMVFVPKEEKLFSAQGCKSISQRINYFVP
ncbi:torsin-3A [Anolis carolinensis]|uniref:Torsin-3A n=1 Tax=Anolis carolinensis TaxID=28377 RepID=H9GIQ8_ANOCA|nr:PREDICTED: torsin-3A isoform X1 [Anolis carolinensis]|eukprot:XP_008116011.1 PREDICTED: torsin-3A isoform X1 [Anolis carolinensis]